MWSFRRVCQGLGVFVLGSATSSAVLYGATLYQAEINEQQIVEAIKKRRCVEILKYGTPRSGEEPRFYMNHVLSYDQQKRIPVWVAEHINSYSLIGTASRKNVDFQTDVEIEPMFASTNEDYRQSGWSRGHMSAAENQKFNQSAMNDTFRLSNILPQDFNNNVGIWNRLEAYCRQLTQKFDDIRIISGSLMLPEVGDDGKIYVKYQLIGKNGIAVPTHLYKIIVAETYGQPVAMGVFVIPNEPIDDTRTLTDFQVSLQELEFSSGIQFFDKLDVNNVYNLCQIDSCILPTFFNTTGVKSNPPPTHYIYNPQGVGPKSQPQIPTPDAYDGQERNR